MNIEPGTVIEGKFEVLDTIGSGGFGTVVRAKQLKFDREVAVKILDGANTDEELTKRFQREAAILSEFQTKYIPSIYGYGMWQGRPYMAIEFLHGKTLASLLDTEHAFPLERAEPIISGIAKALEYAHSRGVVHRDLSPANIVLVTIDGKEEARIIDFGLATFTLPDLRNRQKLTEAGFAVGSFQYMSPEQCLAEPADARSDIYALGCITFRTITGRVPYDADNEVLLMRKHVMEATPHVPSQFPAMIQTVIDKSMAKDRVQRYQNATEFLEDWKQALHSKPAQQGRFARPTIGLLFACLVLVAIAAYVTFAPKPTVAPKPESIRGDLYTALDLAENFRSIPDAEKAAVVDRQRRLLEHVLEVDDRTHELSARDFELACLHLARAYIKQQRYSDGYRLAQRGLDAELGRQIASPLMIRTYATAAAKLDSGAIDRTMKQLRTIIEHRPPFMLPAHGEARMSLAELLVEAERFDEAKQVIPYFDQHGTYSLSEERLLLCSARISRSARQLIRNAKQMDLEMESLPDPERRVLATHEGIVYEQALKTDERTHELSPAEIEEALIRVSVARKYEGRFHEAFEFASRAVDSEMARGTLTGNNLLNFTLTTCNAGADNRARAIAKYRSILEHASGYPMAAQGEARMGLAENLQRDGKCEEALKVLPSLSQAEGYEIYRLRLQQLLHACGAKSPAR